MKHSALSLTGILFTVLFVIIPAIVYANGASEYPRGPVTVGVTAQRIETATSAEASRSHQHQPPTREIFQQGIASWYGQPFHGRLTANGETYNMYGVSAAHKTLAFGTLVEVIDLETGRSVEVRINDRGPFVEGRIIDLSYGAARFLGLENRGLTQVALRIIDGPEILEVHPRLRIQVASFQSRGSAEMLVTRLRTEQLSADLEIHQGQIFRVIIPLDHRSQAGPVLQRLANLGFRDSFVREGS
jgi:rare lipoprotein A